MSVHGARGTASPISAPHQPAPPSPAPWVRCQHRQLPACLLPACVTCVRMRQPQEPRSQSAPGRQVPARPLGAAPLTHLVTGGWPCCCCCEAREGLTGETLAPRPTAWPEKLRGSCPPCSRWQAGRWGEASRGQGAEASRGRGEGGRWRREGREGKRGAETAVRATRLCALTLCGYKDMCAQACGVRAFSCLGKEVQLQQSCRTLLCKARRMHREYSTPWPAGQVDPLGHLRRAPPLAPCIAPQQNPQSASHRNTAGSSCESVPITHRARLPDGDTPLAAPAPHVDDHEGGEDGGQHARQHPDDDKQARVVRGGGFVAGRPGAGLQATRGRGRRRHGAGR